MTEDTIVSLTKLQGEQWKKLAERARSYPPYCERHRKPVGRFIAKLQALILKTQGIVR